jgi:hypothetical protein
MAGVKGLLARVRKLEPKKGHVARKLGDWERVRAAWLKTVEGCDNGDHAQDVRDIVLCIGIWVEAGL